MGILVMGAMACSTDSSSIKNITNEVVKINYNLDNFEKEDFDSYEFATEGTSGNIFFENNEIRKMHLEYFGETGKLIEDYYLKNGDLILIQQENYIYNAPIFVDSTMAIELGYQEGFNPDLTNIIEDKFYFNNNKMVGWIDSKLKSINPVSDTFETKESVLLKHYNIILEKVKR